jgi:hypothetical protein
MRINNVSSHPTKVFYPIVDFITQYDKYSALATLHIMDTDEVFSHGVCHRIDPKMDEILFAAPSLIELRVRKDCIYPVTSLHAMGPVTVWTWEEEVLLVLAHEMAHLNQYYGYPASYSTDQNEEAEEKAEEYAIVLMNLWRELKDFTKHS